MDARRRTRAKAALGFATCAVVACAGAGAGCVTGTIAGLKELESIDVEGNKILSDRDVKAGLAMQPSSPLPLIGEKRFVNADLVREDTKRVPRIYESKGVYGTTVKDVRLVEEGDDKTSVVIEVAEGKPIALEDITIEGLPDDLRAKAPEPALKKGERFTEEDLEKTKGALLRHLAENGHNYAKIEAKAEVFVDRGAARVHLAIDPMRRYKVGPIRVADTSNTRTDQLREHMTLTEGEIFKESERKETEQRLSQLGVFHTTRVEIPSAPPPGEEIPVDVRIAEGSPQLVRLGGGLGVATGRNEIRGRLGYTHNNFLGGLRRFDAELRPAYVFVPDFTGSDQEGLGGKTSVRLYQPDFLFHAGLHRFGGVLSLEGGRDIQDAYTSDNGLARAGIVWPTDSLSSIEAGYDFEVFNLGALPPSVRQCASLCRISYLDQKAVLDKRDEIIFPTNGYWLAISLAETVPGGDFRYLRAVPEARGYVTLFHPVTLAARAQLGFLVHHPEEATPILKRFTLGGPTSHRGFGPRRLSPTVEGRKGRRVAIGGARSVLLNAEARIEVFDKLYFNTFFDTGAVRERQGRIPYEALNHAVGGGLQYDTGVIPIRFDVGYRTNRRPEYAREGAVAYHLNLGEAF